MVIGIVGVLIGLMILCAGIFYLRKEGHDRESRKIYGITILVGAAVMLASAGMLYFSR